jgi:hypothetical protein
MNKPSVLSFALLVAISLILCIGLIASIYFVLDTSSKVDKKAAQITSLEETAQALSTQASLQRIEFDEERSARATSEAMVDLLSIQLDEQKSLLEDEADARATAEAVAQEIASVADEGLCTYLQFSFTPAPIYFDIEEPPPIADEKIIFTSYSIPLREGSGWKVGSPEGSPATIEEILLVLCDLGSLTINFEGDVQILLDNVNIDGILDDDFPGCSDGDWRIDNGTPLADCNSMIGNLPGSISHGSTAASFYAPARYLGNQTVAYGTKLSYDLAVGYGEAQQSADNVVLTPAKHVGTQ